MSSRLLVPVSLVVLLSSCAALESFVALGQVDFSLDRVSDLRLAGVDLEAVRTDGLGIPEGAMIAGALSQGRLPFALDLHVGADNPEENPEARLVAMQWTLFLRDRETVGGRLEREVRIPPGERSEIVTAVELDLLEFFDESGNELLELALSVADAGGDPGDLRLEILPTIETRLGPIRYPRPLVLGPGT